MKTFLQKISSRKLWAAVVGVIFGAAVALGVDAAEIEPIAAAVQKIAGYAGAIASCIAYIIGEAKIDAARVSGENVIGTFTIPSEDYEAVENLGVTEAEYEK